MTWDNPQKAPEKDEFRLRCQSSRDTAFLGVPQGRKRAFENTILLGEIGSICAWLAGDDSGLTTGADFSCNGGLNMG